MFSTIRSRLTLSYLAVIVLAMALSGVLLLTFLERYFLQAMEDSLAAQARITAQALVPGATALGPAGQSPSPAYNTVQQQSGDIALQAQNVAVPTASLTLNNVDLTYLADASLQLSTQLDTRIRILNPGGVVLVDSRQQQGSSLASDALVAQALAGQYASRTDPGGAPEPAMHVAMPVLLEGRLVGIVYLSQPLRDVTAVLHDLRTLWLVPTAIVVALSAIVGLLLSAAITRPLRRLTSAAGAVAAGHLDQQVPVRSRDELGRLSQAFNEMTGRLRAARQMEVDFVANVSHELRTPLTAIKGMVETLRDGAIDDPQVRDRFLSTVEGETDRLIRLVRDLLLLSRADAEALNLQRRPADLAQLVYAAVEQLRPQAGLGGVTLRVEADAEALPAQVDPDRIAQVLINLLDNAIKYSPPGGTVTVHLGQEAGGQLRVRVRDQGMGIPASELARIGERFYRADRARSRTEGGSGLGLAIARALVEAHGGALQIESQEGVGTVVSFTLPQ